MPWLSLGQVLATCARSYSIPWPASFSYAFAISNLMNISPYQLPLVNCLYNNITFFGQAFGYFMAPILLGLYIFFVHKAILLWMSRKTSPEER